MAIHYLESAAELPELDRGQKLVLMCFADSANAENRVGFPGFEKLTKWSNLGRSQLYNVISQLVDHGLIIKVRDGGRGRRAEYAVFPRGGCCPMHGPLPGYEESASDLDVSDEPGSDVPDPAPDLRVSASPEVASDAPDPQVAVQGPIMGPIMGPIAVGPLPGYPATDTHLEGVSHVSSGDDLETPSPQLPDGVNRTCPTHRLTPASGPCPRCGDFRRAVEAADAQRALDAATRAEQARQAARAANELSRRETEGCRLCDVDGRLPSGLACLHDAKKNPKRGSGGFAEFQRLRAAGVKRSTDGRDPESGRRKAQSARAAGS